MFSRQAFYPLNFYLIISIILKQIIPLKCLHHVQFSLNWYKLPNTQLMEILSLCLN